jgi:hypothetical protein
MSERRRIDDLYEPFYDARHYDVPVHECSHEAREKALDAAETLLALAAAGKLDATDLRIIEERSRSPMPSDQRIADTIGIPRRTVCRRAAKVKALITRALRAKKQS